ncbi:hypothetical protein LWI28_007425 [Acer negundo]|uniref:Uncharacterized protein n=1 Tax=Acer negundo TaxID=4023 RepID=A0AAD5IY40_ACENE|nr:hypothetical protein LWI28_007425 [Acer negundo]
MVNGKQICGWPIVSKMADFGWKNRRYRASIQSGSRMVDRVVNNVDGKVNGVKKEEPTSVDSFWLERFLGIMPEIGRSGKIFSPVVASSRISDRVVNPVFVVEHREVVKEGSIDGDKAKQTDNMYHAFGSTIKLKAKVADNSTFF